MAENPNDKPKEDSEAAKIYKSERGPWNYIMRGMWRSPLGLLGVLLTTASASFLIIGLIAEFIGVFSNPYTGIFLFMILPLGMLTGLILMPIAAYLRRRKWKKHGVLREHLQINLSNHRHRLLIVGFIVATSINFTILTVVGYEGYHYTESNEFCGTVCHTVMNPEYTVYQRSPHARVECVSCHIGSGADYFLRAKISGLRQVLGIATGGYSKPIHAPVESLRPSQDTCEKCHWSEKYIGKTNKTFLKYENDTQAEPEKVNLTLYVGGLNPKTNKFDGIHAHIGKEISFLAVDDKRTQIAKVKVKHADGKVDEYVKDDITIPKDKENNWRTMECIDCHNRATHVYHSAEDVVDNGLTYKKINAEITGIREDSLAVINKKYASRDAAQKELVGELLKLQSARDVELAKTNQKDIELAGQYLLDQYLINIWPDMNVGWGTYRSHDNHRNDSVEFGCYRCHDDEHVTKDDKAIVQDCDLCHNDP